MRQLSGVEAQQGLSPTLLAAMGESGNNKPRVAYTLKVRSGCDVDSGGKAAGKGALVQTEKAATLACVQDQYLFQPTAYSFDSLASNSMKSSDPHEPKVSIGLSGEDKVSPTLIARMSSAVGTTQDGLILCEPKATYAVDQGGGKSSCNVTEGTSPTLTCTHGGAPAVAYGLNRASYNQGKNAQFGFSVERESQPTLTAGDWKDPTCVSVNYIVRRLTPTECARLQGFADWHGHVEQKTELTDEEHSFWMEVRNTHAAINGKTVKDYTKAQMLTWYNKLWTDAAEYKMWGNGIALPPALYCMQGITDVLNREEDDAWML